MIDGAKLLRVTAVLAVLSQGILWADDFIHLTEKGVQCELGSKGSFVLGIPALDGRGTHLAPIPSSIKTDGKTLTAQFAAPFEGVGLEIRILEEGRVEYRYSALPEDLKIVMCQFNLPETALGEGLTVSFDGGNPISIPAQPGKTNKDVVLANANASQLSIRWPDGKTLELNTPTKCWHGIQDARVWSKKFVGVCLTPSLKRDSDALDRSTFVLTFKTTGL